MRAQLGIEIALGRGRVGIGQADLVALAGVQEFLGAFNPLQVAGAAPGARA